MKKKQVIMTVLHIFSVRDEFSIEIFVIDHASSG